VAQTVTIGEQKVCPESESLKFSTTPTPQAENPCDSSTPTPQPWPEGLCVFLSDQDPQSLFNFGSSRSLRGHSLNKNMVKFWLDRWQPESKNWSRILKFENRSEVEFEKITLAILPLGVNLSSG